jgi:hypothetical protein
MHLNHHQGTATLDPTPSILFHYLHNSIHRLSFLSDFQDSTAKTT